MSAGTPVSRTCLVMMRDGIPAIDWGGGLFQDILSGEFLRLGEQNVSHAMLDDELDVLLRAGLVFRYDAASADLLPLPELPKNILE
jgi:hypothetical protein